MRERSANLAVLSFARRCASSSSARLRRLLPHPRDARQQILNRRSLTRGRVEAVAASRQHAFHVLQPGVGAGGRPHRVDQIRGALLIVARERLLRRAIARRSTSD